MRQPCTPSKSCQALEEEEEEEENQGYPAGLIRKILGTTEPPTADEQHYLSADGRQPLSTNAGKFPLYPTPLFRPPVAHPAIYSHPPMPIDSANYFPE